MVIEKANPAAWDALNRLNWPEMAPLMTLLRTVKADLVARMIKEDDPKAVYRLQGSLKVIDELIQGAEKAPQMLNRSR